MDQKPFVSVIIPVLDAPKELECCLDVLDNQTYPKDKYEIIVVENGSRENPEDIVKKYSNATLVFEPRQSTHRARNKGITLAKGVILAFTDTDCIPAPSWIEEGVRALEEYPKCDFLGGQIKVVCEDKDKPKAAELFEQITAFNQKKYVNKWHFAATANVFLHKHILDKVGLLDGNLKSGADVDLGQRIYDAGYKQAYGAKAIVSHPARGSLSKVLQKHRRVIGGLIDIRKREGQNPKQMLWAIKDDWPQIRDFVEVFTTPKLLKITHRVKVFLVMILVKIARVGEAIRLISGGKSTWGG